TGMSNDELRMTLLSEFLMGISQTHRILWGDTEQRLSLSLTEAQRQVLFTVAEEGHMTIGDIAKRLRVTNGAVTQLVDGLVRHGVVERRTDTADARRVYVHITNLGAEKLRALHDS